MWIINTILENGDIEEAIAKAAAMNAQRPSYLPPQGFLLSALARISSQAMEVPGVIDVTVIESSYTA